MTLPALYGTGKMQDGLPGPFEINELKRFCEEFSTTPDGTWSLRADICTPDVIQLFEGELLELLTINFRTLMDLKYFHEGTFTLDVPLSDSTIQAVDFCPEVISMCSALGVSIEIRYEAN